MQCAAIEFGRDVIGLASAHSTEFDKDTPHPVICLLDEQRNVTQLGGTMRLGAQPCHLMKDSAAHRAYQSDVISERHRHRYEFNNLYRQQYEAHGMRFTGLSPDGGLVEILELPNHAYFVAVQFHPEFKSKPTRAHPLFAAFVGAAMKRRIGRKQQRPMPNNSEESSKSSALTPP
jgi:CTP synthase